MSHDQLRDRLLAVGFGPYAGSFADGQLANNKLDLDYAHVAQDPDLLAEVADGLYAFTKPFRPQFVIGVPNGATGFAQAVAARFRIWSDVRQPVLIKNQVARTMDYRSERDESIVAGLSRGILIEDVLNRRASTGRALRVAGLAPKIVAVIGIFDRGLPAERQLIDVPVHSLVQMEIPAILPEQSELWKEARPS